MTEATPLASEQITQEDREAAYEFTRTGYMAGSDGIKLLIDIIARHRIAALSASPAPSRTVPLTLACERSPAPSGQGVSGADLFYERQYFERGMFAAYAWMVTNRSGSLLADAVVDNAWENRDAGMSAEDMLPVRAPAPSCAPGEVGALAWISGYAADFARNPDQPTNTIRNAFTAIERKAAAALSPQGLDAKEGGE